MKIRILVCMLVLVLSLNAQDVFPVKGLSIEQAAPNPMSQTQISAVYAPAGAAGAITLYYWVSTTYPIGAMFPVGPVIVTGTAALGGPNTVRINWPTQAGATSYTVVRTLTPQFPTTGACAACALVVNAPTTTLLDNGAVLVAAFQTSGIDKATAYVLVNDRDWATPTLNLGNSNVVGFRVQTLNNFQMGNPATPYTNFNNGDDIFNINITDTDGSVRTTVFNVDSTSVGSLAASDIRASSIGGNSLALSIRSVQGVSHTATGTTSIGEMWGGNFIAHHQVGNLRSLYGVVGSAELSAGTTIETDGIIAGVLGELDSNLTLGFPYISGAVLGRVAWAAAPQEFDGAFVAFRTGGGAGGTEGAAFRVKQDPAAILDSFTFGLDLYAGVGGGGGEGVTTSIRGETRATIDNDSAETWRIDGFATNGRLGIGVAAAADTLLHARAVTANNAFMLLEAEEGVVQIIASQFFDGTDGADVVARHTRGDYGAQTILVDTDELGAFRMTGYDGVGFVGGAEISAIAEGVVAAGDMPTTLVFSSSNAGAVAMTERMRLNVGGGLTMPAVTFATLPASANGTMLYCSNCDPAAAGAGPTVCASAGAQTGTFAFRLNGAWTCVGI